MVNRFISYVIMIISEDSFITNLELKVAKLPPIFHQLTAWLRQGVQPYWKWLRRVLLFPSYPPTHPPSAEVGRGQQRSVIKLCLLSPSVEQVLLVSVSNTVYPTKSNSSEIALKNFLYIYIFLYISIRYGPGMMVVLCKFSYCLS